MGEVTAEEADQTAGNREQVLVAALIGGIGIDPQLPAVFLPPVRVEIKDDRDQAVLGTPKLVQVLAVIGPGGIDGQVALELEQAQEEGAVDGLA